MDAGPTYSVRTSTRARYAHLTVSPRDGVVVVVPRRFDRSRIPELVASRAEWIRRAERRIERERASVVSDDRERPASVELRAVGESWRVEYAPGDQAAVVVRARPGAVLVVSGTTDDAPQVAAGLARWLVARTRADVVPWLVDLAGAHGLRVSGTSVRAQRSRWASCSSAGRVSLSRNLLFLPRELAEHVLLHEICHLRELSHSPRFWRLLESVDPATATRRRDLLHAWKYVPGWAQP